MAISFHCPNCGKAFRVPDRSAGRTSNCWECKATITVPAQSEEIELDSPPVAPAPTLRVTNPAARAAPRLAEESFTPPPTQRAPQLTPRRSLNPGFELSDSAARAISLLVFVASLAGAIYFAHQFTERLSDRGLPDALAGRMWGYLAIVVIRGLIILLAVFVPTLLWICALATSWTSPRAMEAGYVRALGTMSLPLVMTIGLLLMALDRSIAGALIFAIATPFVLIIGLKELMGLRWSTTLISAMLLLVAIPLEGVMLNFILIRPTNNAILSMTGLDDESVRTWIKEHPDEAKGMRASSGGAVATGGASQAHRAIAPPPAPVAAPDPLAGKIEPLEPEALAAIARAPSQTKEQIRAAREALSAKVEPLRTTEPSALWNKASGWLSRLAQLEGEAPSESAPAELLTPIDERSLGLAKGYDDEFDAQAVAFAGVQLHPPKESQIDLRAYDQRARLQRWKLPNHVTIELSTEPLASDKQQRPWVGDRESVAQLAGRQNLFAIVDFPASDVSYGRAGELLWTRITKRGSSGFDQGATYVTRLPEQWLIVRLRSQYRAQVELGDKFIQRIAPLDAKQPAADAYDPSRLVELFNDPFADPSPIIKASGAKGLQALQAYVLRLGPKAPHNATRLLDEMTSADPTAAKSAQNAVGSVLDVSNELRILKDPSNHFDKEGALKRLAMAKADPKRRDEVAAVLEQLLSGSESPFFVEPACDALGVWWRSQSVVALLPLLEENIFPPSRRAHAMKALAQTGDKRAVYPIVRWIIKEPNEVVDALTTIGPVAEDEVVKLLRERNNDARKNAARILSEIGSAKCLPELRRAANDPRDPSAATEAKSAVEAVVARVKRAKAASNPSSAPSVGVK